MTSIFLPVVHIQQRHIGECLAACALMVLEFIGEPVSYKRLMRILKTRSGYGTPSSNIVLLKQLGISVDYRRGNIADLRTCLLAGNPPIVFVSTKELPYWNDDIEHAVVVIGIDDEYIYVNDPGISISPMQVTQGDFDLAWLEHNESYATLTVE